MPQLCSQMLSDITDISGNKKGSFPAKLGLQMAAGAKERCVVEAALSDDV